MIQDQAVPLRDQFLIDLVQTAKSLDFKDNHELINAFKEAVYDWIFNSPANSLTPKPHATAEIIQGCTQYIDSLYMQGACQHLDGDYAYHSRLGHSPRQVGQLTAHVPLIMAMPFPLYGGVHPQYADILEECKSKNIDIHIDAAWLSSAHNIKFDFSQAQIKSYAVSLSKGMGLGWNRIGVRWSQPNASDSITIMNQYDMLPRACVFIGLHYLRSVPKNYLWSTYEQAYYQVCEEFSLTPTNSIHLALRDNRAVGVSRAILSRANSHPVQ